MTLIRIPVLACLAMTGATVPAQAAFQAIYEVLGVYDNGSGSGLGIATSIHCSNMTANPVNVRVHVRRGNGDVVGTITAPIVGQGTRTFSTHFTALFGDSSLNTGLVEQGKARILSEVPAAIVCAADLVDASSSTAPAFIAPRRMIRLPRSSSGGED